MDYTGTSADDIIDQVKLSIPSDSNIYGGAGNDKITFENGRAIGEAGNDTLIATGNLTSAMYWNSPAGVNVNLATGIAFDGFGTVDTLVNIHSVHDSGYDDTLTGSTGNDYFWLAYGSDTVRGGGGRDTVYFYNVKSTDASISYDLVSATFTIQKNFANGDRGTTRLTAIDSIVFVGPHSDNVTLTKAMFTSGQGFVRGPTSTGLQDMMNVAQIRSADFNGDGKADILAVRIHPDLGHTAQPLQILLGDGDGHFVDRTAELFRDGMPMVNYVPRIFTADFNQDGRADIFSPDFGLDTLPFPGGQNSMYLSDKDSGLLENATATLPQGKRGNHGTAIGDVNKDGFPDVLVNVLNDPGGNANQLLINDGNGKLVLSQERLPAILRPAGFEAGWTWSMLGDLNQDGYDDAVMGVWDKRGGPSEVFLNDGRGSFAGAQGIALPASGIHLETVIGIETIDLNGDALPDLMLSVVNGGDAPDFYRIPYLQLLINDGNGRFHDETQLRFPQPLTRPAEAPAEWYLSATAVDFNGDGLQDILLDNPFATSKVMFNDGSGKFNPGWESPVGAHVVVADVNGDGKPDIVEASHLGFTADINVFPARIPANHVYHAAAAGGAVLGSAAAETVYAGGSNDTVDAAGGRDLVIYAGNRADYTVSATGTGYTVTSKTGSGGVDTLSNVERLRFADAWVALDVNGVGGQAFRLYKAALNRLPDEAGLGFHIWAMETAGLSLNQVAQAFIESPEFVANYGQLDNLAFVTRLYHNVLGREPDPGGLKFHVDLLNAGTITRAQDLVGFSESAENMAALIGVIGNGFSFVPLLASD
jgi:hypothetical protein